jgi:hypothetical protein
VDKSAVQIVESLTANPWISDGDPLIPLDICKWCRHTYSIDESKAHYKRCEWVEAREWLAQYEDQTDGG